MRSMSRVSVGVICLLAWGIAAPASAGGRAPIAVSPGSADGFSAVGSACPTFSWGPVAGAAGYEVVVYSAAEESLAGGGKGSAAAAPVIRQRVPGGALSWTPPRESCLELVGAYSWAARAVGGEGAGGWSEPLLFRVDPKHALGDVVGAVERALGRYLEERGLRYEAGGELAALVAEELAGGAGAAGTRSPESPPARRDSPPAGRPGAPAAVTRGVFGDEVELWLQESGSGPSDKVQLVFATPEFDGDPFDAWAIIVEAENSADPDDGKMFFSTPSFSDALQLFTDGSAILGEQREMKLRPSSSPPIACTSFLQEGMLYWDSDISALCVCDGSAWAPVDSDNMGSCS